MFTRRPEMARRMFGLKSDWTGETRYGAEDFENSKFQLNAHYE